MTYTVCTTTYTWSPHVCVVYRFVVSYYLPPSCPLHRYIKQVFTPDSLMVVRCHNIWILWKLTTPLISEDLKGRSLILVEVSELESGFFFVNFLQNAIICVMYTSCTGLSLHVYTYCTILCCYFLTVLHTAD